MIWLFCITFCLQAYIIIFQNVQLVFVMCSLENHQIKGLGTSNLFPQLICWSYTLDFDWFPIHPLRNMVLYPYFLINFILTCAYTIKHWIFPFCNDVIISYSKHWLPCRYQILGVFLLIQLCIIATEGLRRSNLSSIASSAHQTSLGMHQTSAGYWAYLFDMFKNRLCRTSYCRMS